MTALKSLNSRVLLALAITIGCFLAISTPIFNHSLLHEAEKAELRILDDSLNRVQREIYAEAEFLHQRSVEWAQWDDAYLHLQGKRPEFVESNLSSVTLEGMKVDALIYADLRGRLVDGQLSPAAEASGLSLDQLTESLKTAIRENAGPIDIEGISGLALVQGRLTMVSMRPVVDTNKRQAPAGWLIMASSWSESRTLNLRAHTGLDLALTDATQNRELISRTDFVITGRRLLTDAAGKPVATVSVRIFRREHASALQVIAAWSVGAIVALVAIVGIVYLLMKLIVLKRIMQLRREIESVSECDLTDVDAQGVDELSDVARSINRLLRAMNGYQMELAATEQEVRAVNAHLEETVRQRTASLDAERKVMENALEGAAYFDLKGRRQRANAAFHRMTGGLLESRPASWKKLLSREDFQEVKEAGQLCLEYGKSDVEIEIRLPDGSSQPIRLVLMPDRDASDRLLGIHAFAADISRQKSLEEELFHQANYDPLTGLANRRLFLQILDAMLAQTDGEGLAVLFLDLDNFKLINDSLGHHKGDQLLVEMAERLIQSAGPGSHVCRMAGDEFTILLQAGDDPVRAAFIADTILERITEPVSLSGREVQVSASVGIAFAAPGISSSDLLRQADTAMYQSKARGRNQCTVFQEEMIAATMERLEIEIGLRMGLEFGELRLHYQPVMDMATGSLTGCEALVRWDRPGHGLIPPGRFISIAEESHLIEDIGWWVLEEACRQGSQWDADFFVSVNLASRQILSSEILDRVQDVLIRTSFDPRRLKLEITESILVADIDLALTRLAQLKSLGTSLALDDFGTGYSSLSYLARLPVDTLKIDRSFVQVLGESNERSAIVGAIIAMSHSMGISVVAEGIETPDQAQILRTLKCDLGQGFLFSRPLAPDNFQAFLEERQRKAA